MEEVGIDIIIDLGCLVILLILMLYLIVVFIVEDVDMILVMIEVILCDIVGVCMMVEGFVE